MGQELNEEWLSKLTMQGASDFITKYKGVKWWII